MSNISYDYAAINVYICYNYAAIIYYDYTAIDVGMCPRLALPFISHHSGWNFYKEIRRSAVREADVSRHHGCPINDLLLNLSDIRVILYRGISGWPPIRTREEIASRTIGENNSSPNDDVIEVITFREFNYVNI